MSLYDKNYNEAALGGEFSVDESRLKSFIKQTYQLFAASLLAATVGAYIGIGAFGSIASFILPLVILEFVCIFALSFAVRSGKNNLALGLLFAFTFLSGLTLSPALTMLLATPAGAGIITNAFLMTTVAFGALSFFAMSTSKDFTTMTKMLFIGLIVVVVASLLGMFFQSTLFSLVISGISAVLFSFFILHDTQNIIRGNYTSPILAASQLYLDFLNLFVALLQILSIFSKDE